MNALNSFKVALFAFAVGLPQPLYAASARVFPAVDGMLIHGHKNHWQQLEVRAKSFGPGICQTRIIFMGSIVDIPAPPLTWSGWFKVGPPFAGSAHNLAFESVCDTGSIGEVKYVPQD
jgi:hypothetical protein